MLPHVRILRGGMLDQVPHAGRADDRGDVLAALHQVPAQLGHIHSLGILQAPELGGRVQHHHGQEEQEVQAQLDQPQPDAHVHIVDNVLDLGFKGPGYHADSSLRAAGL